MSVLGIVMLAGLAILFIAVIWLIINNIRYESVKAPVLTLYSGLCLRSRRFSLDNMRNI
jgi:type IV secretory pathway VirB3-like protein